MYVVYINLLYFLSIFLFTYNKNLLSQKKMRENHAICVRVGNPAGFRVVEKDGCDVCVEGSDFGVYFQFVGIEDGFESCHVF